MLTRALISLKRLGFCHRWVLIPACLLHPSSRGLKSPESSVYLENCGSVSPRCVKKALGLRNEGRGGKDPVAAGLGVVCGAQAGLARCFSAEQLVLSRTAPIHRSSGLGHAPRGSGLSVALGPPQSLADALGEHFRQPRQEVAASVENCSSLFFCYEQVQSRPF